MTRNRNCEACHLNPVAYTGRRWCYRCVPRQRRQPWTCRRCGTTEDYYAKQLCRRCHRNAPVVASCRDCLAWGATRRHDWRCQPCLGWALRHQPAECPACLRVVPLNQRGFCRLCCRQATRAGASEHEAVDVVAANREGQQLWIAYLGLRQPRQHPEPPSKQAGTWPAGFPVAHRQLAMFDLPADLERLRVASLAEAATPVPELLGALDRAVDDHATVYGWGIATTSNTKRGMRAVLAIQATPGAPVLRTETEQLRSCAWFTLQPVLDVLAGIGMLEDDRPRPLEHLFHAQTSGLPDGIRDPVRSWFCALRDGRATTPRTKPRHASTVDRRLRQVAPALHVWAAAGHTSLRDITSGDIIEVLDGLPPDATRRSTTLVSLRSLFRFLNAARSIFADPTSRLRGDRIRPTPMVPLDLKPIRDALSSSDPVVAAITALAAFHALSNRQIRTLHLTDISDGRISLGHANVVLAEPVRQRLATWITHRNQRWPTTANAHLFINSYTAIRTTPITAAYTSTVVGYPVQLIRQDRMLDEAIATGGDVRRLCDLFGITVGAAERYAISADPR